MKKQDRVLLVLTMAMVALGLVIAGCDLGGNGDEATNQITGVVRDAGSGELVAAVTVSFGNSNATTGADGSFSLDLGASSGVVIDDFSVYGSGYISRFVAQAPVDASQSTSLTIYLDRIDVSTYTLHQFDLTVEDETNTEISTGSYVMGAVLNTNGGFSTFEINNYANPGTNTVYTAAFGSDCLIAVHAYTMSTDFVAMARQLDLSAVSSNQTLTGTVGTSVSVTPDTPGNYGMLMLQSPYGGLEVFADQITTSPDSITIYNPYNYDGFWAQAFLDTTPPDSEKMYISTSSVGPIGSSVALPALNLTLGPSGGYPAGYSISYSAPTLSFDTVSDALVYVLFVWDQATGDELAVIFSFGASVTLPSWLVTELSGTTADVMLITQDSSGNADLAAFSRLGSYPPETQLGVALENGGTDYADGYLQTINF